MTRTLFGTDGVRGVAGRPPMDAATAFRLGRATCDHLQEKTGRTPTLILGMDTRRSSPMLGHAFTAGACARGGQVTWTGVLPTPGVAFLTRHRRADAGVVVSASHNPFADNGIKVFDADGRKLSDGEEAAIERRVGQEDADGTDRVGAEIGSSDRYDRRDGAYHEFLLSHAPFLDGMRLGLDCANGAASEIAPAVFRRIGARLDVIHAAPDGRNVNAGCGSTHPEVIREHVRSHGLDVGVTFDGDADRVLLVDRRGRLVTGDHVLAIVARVRGDREVVATLMTNLGVERWLADHGITLHRTQVGDRYVDAALRERGLRLGGEQSGHVLFLDRAPTGDGILSALRLLAAVRTSGRSLEAWMDEIPSFPQALRNVPVPEADKAALAAHPTLREATAEVEREFAGEVRVNVRPSGTEALLRVMVTAPDEARVSEIADRFEHLIAGLTAPA